MKVIIAGSRQVTDYNAVKSAIEASGFKITKVLSGCARGVDRFGERWAKENNVSVVYFPADWEQYGKRAGMLRNFEMAGLADALIAVWDMKSKGTKNMIDLARKGKLKVYIGQA